MKIINKALDDYPDQAALDKNPTLIKHLVSEMPWAEQKFFLLMNLAYQTGVTISKGSLAYLQIDRIYMLTVLQALNWGFLWLNTQHMWITTVYFMFPFYIWVGLMGGATYVNVMFKLLNMDTLSNEDKQSALVLSLMFQETGKILSSTFVLIVSNFIIVCNGHFCGGGGGH